MAENIYTKGTRVWFPDKEQGWISAEVTQVSKGENDSIKLIFVDERGKVRRVFPHSVAQHWPIQSLRKLRLIRLAKI